MIYTELFTRRRWKPDKLSMTLRWMYFFFKKVHTTQRSHEALHGFDQESTRTTLVPAQQDLKEEDEVSRTQPWSARGPTEPKKFLQLRKETDAEHSSS